MTCIAAAIPRNGIILILCGPAGSGKTTLCDQMLAQFGSLKRIITATTRKPRPGERHGEHYFFFTEADFKEHIEAGAFYEHAKVHGRHYGTLKSEVQAQLNAGNDILLNIDVQGAASFREHATHDPLLASRLRTIFIRPESVEVIRERLRERQSDSEAEIERRLQTALQELATAESHDYILPTSTRERDFELMRSIYLAEKHRVVRLP